MIDFQVTIGSNNRVQFPRLDFQPQHMTVQNNSTHDMRVGATNIVAGAYGVGLGTLITSGGGSFTFQLGQDYSTRTSEWWAAGTPGDILDVKLI